MNACLDDFRARVLEIRQQLIDEGYDGNAIQIKERFAKPKHSALMFLAELGKPMDGEEIMCSAQRISLDKRDRAADPERAHDMPIASPTPTNEASLQTVWPTQGDREVAITRESHSNDQSSDNNDSHLTIPDPSPIGDAAGSLFSILTPDPGGQTTDNRPVRRPQPKKKKRGRSV